MPRILTLNDKPAILQGIHRFLEADGYQHLYTTDSRQALSILRQETIDLFVQDILRPDMNGFELYWRIKSEEALCDIPILILSAWSVVWSAVWVTPFDPAGKARNSFYRVEFRGTQPKHLSAVAGIQEAHVLYVEGYLELGVACSEIVDAIQVILDERDRTPLSEEEKAFRRERLWSRARVLASSKIV